MVACEYLCLLWFLHAFVEKLCEERFMMWTEWQEMDFMVEMVDQGHGNEAKGAWDEVVKQNVHACVILMILKEVMRLHVIFVGDLYFNACCDYNFSVMIT